MFMRPAYQCLPDLGFIHETVNPQENYVNPNTGAHTQSIKRAWLYAKKKKYNEEKERSSTVNVTVVFRPLLLGDVATN